MAKFPQSRRGSEKMSLQICFEDPCKTTPTPVSTARSIGEQLELCGELSLGQD